VKGHAAEALERAVSSMFRRVLNEPAVHPGKGAVYEFDGNKD